MPKVQKKKTNNLAPVVEKIHQQVNLPKSHVKEVINELLEVIGESLAKGENMSLIGYFAFSTRKQPAKEMVMRFGKSKGKKIKIPAKIVPTFKFSSAFKKRIVE